MKVDHYEHKNKSSTPTPPIARNILDKERGGTFGKIFNLEFFSHIIRTCFKIKAVCVCCNATDTLCLLNEHKIENRALHKHAMPCWHINEKNFQLVDANTQRLL